MKDDKANKDLTEVKGKCKATNQILDNDCAQCTTKKLNNNNAPISE